MNFSVKSYMNPTQGDKIMTILDVKKFLFILRRARIGISFLFGYQQVSDPELIMILKRHWTLERSFHGTIQIKPNFTNFPASIPHVSTFLSVFGLAKTTNSESKVAGMMTFLNPIAPFVPARGFKLRSNSGTDLQNQVKCYKF